MKDPRASFRVLVGAHLAFTAAMESIDRGRRRRGGARASARALTGDGVPAPDSLRDKKRRAALEGRLCEAIRNPKTSAAELDAMHPALRASLLAKLRVNSPRFDTRADIE